jgi:CBS domain-containing protein
MVPVEAGAAPAAGDRLGDVVRPVAVTVEASASLREMAVQMTANDVGLVVVTGQGRLLGVVSERDIVRALADDADPDDDRAEDVMAIEVVSAHPDTTITAAVGLMVEGGIRHLPVVEDGRVVGVVSMRDLAALLGDRETDRAPADPMTV